MRGSRPLPAAGARVSAARAGVAWAPRPVTRFADPSRRPPRRPPPLRHPWFPAHRRAPAERAPSRTGASRCTCQAVRPAGQAGVRLRERGASRAPAARAPEILVHSKQGASRGDGPARCCGGAPRPCAPLPAPCVSRSRRCSRGALRCPPGSFLLCCPPPPSTDAPDVSPSPPAPRVPSLLFVCVQSACLL